MVRSEEVKKFQSNTYIGEGLRSGGGSRPEGVDYRERETFTAAKACLWSESLWLMRGFTALAKVLGPK